MKTIFLFLFLLKFCLQVNIKNETWCEGRPNHCCAGYILDNKSGLCVECPRGYFGPHCNRQCPYPQFGRSCQGRCHCERMSCNEVTGCTKEKISDKLRTEKPFSTKKALISTVDKDNVIKESILNVEKAEDNYMQRESIADEDRTTPIQYPIICLGGISGILLMMYIASHAVKRHRRPGKVIDMEEKRTSSAPKILTMN